MASKKDTAPSQQGRKPLPKAEPAGPQLDPAALAARHGELVVMNEEHRKVLDTFGEGLPYVRELYIAESQRDMRTAAEAGVRIGRRLIVMKAHEPHGEWMSCLAQVGIGQDTAERMMAAARRLQALPNSAPARNLLEATKSQSKLFELLSLPEDQFKELAVSGKTGSLELDEIEAMTRDELRAAVRDARADLEAKDQRITKLSDDVNRAEEKAAKAAKKWKAATPDEQQNTLEQRILTAKLDIISNIGTEKIGLAAAMLELAEHCNKHGLDCSQFMGDTLNELIASVRRVRDDYDYGFDVALAIDEE